MTSPANIVGLLFGAGFLASPPVWITAAGTISEVQSSTPISARVQATHPLGRLTYEIVDGSLPPGSTLAPTTGSITGPGVNISAFAPSEAPLWTQPTATFLQVDELASATITFSAIPRLGTVITYMVIPVGTVEAGPPFGMVLDAQTGVLAGSVEDTAGAPIQLTPTPVWNTPAGTIAVLDEGASATITLQVTPQLGTIVANYFIVDGGLPFGLLLNDTTGVIAGVAADQLAIAPPDAVASPPTWTGAVNLANVARGGSLTSTLTAVPSAGRNIVFYEMRTGDAVPVGLVLNGLSGVISGTVASDAAVGPYVFTVTVQDDAGARASRSFNISVF